MAIGLTTYVNLDDAPNGPAVHTPCRSADSDDSRPYAGNVEGSPDCRA